jgi:hypothetical protein
MRHRHHDPSFTRALREILRALLCCPDGDDEKLRITARFKGFTCTATGELSMDFKDTDLPGTVTLSVAAPVDAKGHTAKLDGIPVWELDDESNAQIVSQADDGLSCVVHLDDTPSATQVRVSADADLGDGVREIVAVAVLNVVPGDAVGFGDIQVSPVTPDPSNP